MKEIWNKVRGFKYYEVSNLGRIRSLDRSVKHNYGGTAIKKGKVNQVRDIYGNTKR